MRIESYPMRKTVRDAGKKKDRGGGEDAEEMKRWGDAGKKKEGKGMQGRGAGGADGSY